jgi:tetratricopeptide (TPR) repeat protein
MIKSSHLSLGFLVCGLVACTTSDSVDVEINRSEQQARAFASEGRYAESIQAYEQSLQSQLAHPASDPARLANTEVQLAGLHYRLHEFTTAAQLYRQAIELETKRLGPEDADVLGLNSILAGLEIKLQHPQVAEQLLRRQLEISQRVYGVERRETATILVNLAEALEAQGRTAEATSCRQDASRIRHKLCDEC